MKSEIKIDFIDRGTGVGIEPVIRVELRSSDDPRDKLIHVLFQSLQEDRFMQFYYSAKENLPDTGKQVLLFKPENGSLI